MKRLIGKGFATIIITMALSVLMTVTVFAAVKVVSFTFNTGNTTSDFESNVQQGEEFNNNDILKCLASDTTNGFSLPNLPKIRVIYQYSNERHIKTEEWPSHEGETEFRAVIRNYGDFNSWIVDRVSTPSSTIFEVYLKPNNSEDPATPSEGGSTGVTHEGREGEKYEEVILRPDPDNPIVEFEVSEGELPPGLELKVTDDGTLVLTGTPTKPGTYTFTIRVTLRDGQVIYVTRTIIIKEKSSKSSSKKKHSSDDSTPINPDAITVNYYLNQADYASHKRDPKAEFGKQAQGPACQAAFNASVPQGWSQAFTFSMSYEKKHTSTLKDGIIEVYIPYQYMKAGRSYGLMAMDKSGAVRIYTLDADTYPYVFTSPINVEGYAFSLIIKD